MKLNEFNSGFYHPIFSQSIEDFHIKNDIYYDMKNRYDMESQPIEYLLYQKSFIDSVQWHMEDIVRDPEIEPSNALTLKRRIDKWNQERNDLVEKIDAWFLQFLTDIKPQTDAKMNSESPAWIIDRLSIMEQKIYHMHLETIRKDASEDHIAKCKVKYNTLLEQYQDLSQCLTELIEDILSGKKYMKVYRQMKMYNDPTMNPVLYKKSN